MSCHLYQIHATARYRNVVCCYTTSFTNHPSDFLIRGTERSTQAYSVSCQVLQCMLVSPRMLFPGAHHYTDHCPFLTRTVRHIESTASNRYTSHRILQGGGTGQEKRAADAVPLAPSTRPPPKDLEERGVGGKAVGVGAGGVGAALVMLGDGGGAARTVPGGEGVGVQAWA